MTLETDQRPWHRRLGHAITGFVDSVPIKLFLFLISAGSFGQLLLTSVRDANQGDPYARRAPLLWLCLISTGLLIGILIILRQSASTLQVQEQKHAEELKLLSRKARFADAAPSLSQGFDNIRDANYLVWEAYDGAFRTHNGEKSVSDPMSDAVKRAIADNIESAIRSWATAFSTIVGSNCRVCLKKVDYEETDADPGAVHRFTVSDVCRSNPEDLYEEDRSADTIEGNTGFLQAMRRGSWLGLDLLTKYKNHEYANSHWDRDPAAVLSDQGPSYLSTINWALQQKLPGGGKALFGFLCVDCRLPDGFTPEDVALGDSLARAIVAPLVAVIGGLPSATAQSAVVKASRKRQTRKAVETA